MVLFNVKLEPGHAWAPGIYIISECARVCRTRVSDFSDYYNWPLKSHVAIVELFCEGVVVFESFCACWLLLSLSEDTVRSTDSKNVVSQTVPFARREYS